ncbi:MAG: hypothetical protein WC758_02650 [Candidatus Woesearchaeota archaeon]|jgi:hypothetical protein
MHFKSRHNKSISDIGFDLDSMDDSKFDTIGSLNDDELEFLRFKKSRARLNFQTPDPRLGDYET